MRSGPHVITICLALPPTMRSLLLLSAAAVATAGSTLEFSRVHYVDHSATGNFLFRSNMPVLVNNTTNTSYFAYDALVSFMKQRIATEAPEGTTFPAQFFLNIHSLDNIFETSDTQYEVAWAQANPTIGNVSFWPLLGQLVPPQWVNQTERDALATNNTALWGVDELPQRMVSIRDMLDTQYDVPHVFLCECTPHMPTDVRRLGTTHVFCLNLTAAHLTLPDLTSSAFLPLRTTARRAATARASSPPPTT